MPVLSQPEIATFNFDGATLRTTAGADGEPWFVAADVCAALSYDHTPSALRRLDEEEKGVHSTHTLGGPQQVATVNESGLYSLILGSRKPEAKRFKKWVTAKRVSLQPTPLVASHGLWLLTFAPRWKSAIPRWRWCGWTTTRRV